MKRPDWLIVKPKPTPFQKFQTLAKGLMQVPVGEVRKQGKTKGKRTKVRYS